MKNIYNSNKDRLKEQFFIDFSPKSPIRVETEDDHDRDLTFLHNLLFQVP